LGYIMYFKENTISDKVAASLKGFYRAAFRKFYFDEIYLFITKRILFAYVSKPVAWFDRHVVDGTMNGFAWVTTLTSEKIKHLQSGQIQKYGFIFIGGALALVFVFIYLCTN
jgi:NADH-quinone oxidoreductase subunit L